MPTTSTEPALTVEVQKVESLSAVESALLQIVNADSSNWTGIKDGIAYVAGTNGADDGNRTLRGAVLRAFCLAPNALDRLGPAGLTLKRIRITDDVNLAFARIPFPLVFHKCKIKGELNLMHSCVPHIRFKRGSVRGINANGAHIKGDMSIEGGRVLGPVKLRNAEIVGDLRITDARIHNEAGVAIAAQGLQARGSVRLTGPDLRVVGCITLASAHIGADLVCSGGALSCPVAPASGLKDYERECAMYADGVSVEGDLAMKDDVRVTGETRMLGARVRGAAKFNGDFRSPAGGDVVSLDGITVGGLMTFNTGFHSTGTVRLIGAEIRKDLDCTGAILDKPLDPHEPDRTNRRKEDVLRRIALSAGRMIVRGSVFFDEVKTTGAVRLVGARIGGELRANRASFKMHNEGYEDLQARDFGLSVFNARDARIQAGCDLANCETNGMLVFQRSHIGADLSVRNLTLVGSLVNGLMLKGADIRGKLSWEGTRRGPCTKLVLSHASVGRLVHDVDSWPEPGRLFLRGLTYHTISITPRQDDESARPQGTRLSHKFTDWVRLQPKEAFDPHPYEQLSRVLKRNGDDDAFREVGIAKEQDWLKRNERSRRERALGKLLGSTLRYGYDARPLLKATFAILALGTVLFGIGSLGSIRLLAPTDPEILLDSAYAKLGKVPGDYPAFNTLAYSIDTFLPPVIDFHQETHWLPDARRGHRLISTPWVDLHWGGLLRGYLWIHIAAGWVATSLLVVYLTRLIRDH